MKRETDKDTSKTSDKLVIYCSGLTRAGVPCGNSVTKAGEFCGRCAAPVENAYPLPEPAESVTELEERVQVSGGWTMAESVAERLQPFSDNQELRRLIDIGVNLASKSKSESTQVTYATHWRTFETFREAYDLGDAFPVPAEHVLLFIAYLTDRGSLREPGERLSHGYIRQIAGAIQNRHTSRGVPSPTDDPAVAEILTGYAKVFGKWQEGKVPIGIAELGTITAHLISEAADTTASRNRLLVMFATHPDLRLSLAQISALDGEHIVYEDGLPIGLLVTGRGGSLSSVDMPVESIRSSCPREALIDYAPASWGPVFRNARDTRLSKVGVQKILKATISKALSADRWEKGEVPLLDAEERSVVTSELRGEPLAILAVRALILNGYWAAFRGEEVSNLVWSDLRTATQGIEWKVRRAKNDQLGQGETTAIPLIDDPFLCAVQATNAYHQAVENWLQRPTRPDEPVFFDTRNSKRTNLKQLTRETLANNVNQAALAAGLPEGPYSIHSLRAGFTTDAINLGNQRRTNPHPRPLEKHQEHQPLLPASPNLGHQQPNQRNRRRAARRELGCLRTGVWLCERKM